MLRRSLLVCSVLSAATRLRIASDYIFAAKKNFVRFVLFVVR